MIDRSLVLAQGLTRQSDEQLIQDPRT